MNINPARKQGESFAQYRVRRWEENEAVKTAILGRETVGYGMGLAHPQHGRQLPLADMQWRAYRFGLLGVKVLSMTPRSMARKQRQATA